MSWLLSRDFAFIQRNSIFIVFDQAKAAIFFIWANGRVENEFRKNAIFDEALCNQTKLLAVEFFSSLLSLFKKFFMLSDSCSPLYLFLRVSMANS